MTLKFPLSREISKIINIENVDYALPLDIDRDGNFGNGFFVVTKENIFIFYKDQLFRKIELKDYKDFTTEMCVGGGSFFAVIMILFYGTSVFADMGIRPDFWNQSRGYHNYGFSFMFFCNLIINISKITTYSTYSKHSTFLI